MSTSKLQWPSLHFKQSLVFNFLIVLPTSDPNMHKSDFFGTNNLFAMTSYAKNSGGIKLYFWQISLKKKFISSKEKDRKPFKPAIWQDNWQQTKEL